MSLEKREESDGSVWEPLLEAARKGREEDERNQLLRGHLIQQVLNQTPVIRAAKLPASPAASASSASGETPAGRKPGSAR